MKMERDPQQLDLSEFKNTFDDLNKSLNPKIIVHKLRSTYLGQWWGEMQYLLLVVIKNKIQFKKKTKRNAIWPHA